MKSLSGNGAASGPGARYALEMARALSEHAVHETLLSLAEGRRADAGPVLRGAVDLPLYTYANAQEFIRRSLDIDACCVRSWQRLEAEPPDAAIVTMMGYWDIFLIGSCAAWACRWLSWFTTPRCIQATSSISCSASSVICCAKATASSR